MIHQKMSGSDKRQLLFLILWLISGLGMIIMGISALINSGKTLVTVSNILGTFALFTAVITFLVRISQKQKGTKVQLGFDWLIWFFISLLLFNTNILLKLGKIAFIISGIILIFEGIRSFIAAGKSRSEHEWYIPRLIFSGVFIILGITVIINAEKIFEGMIVLSIGIYLIIHGVVILYEWIGRFKYFRNFRGLE